MYMMEVARIQSNFSGRTVAVLKSDYPGCVQRLVLIYLGELLDPFGTHNRTILGSSRIYHFNIKLCLENL